MMPPAGRASAIGRTVLARGTLATRLVVAGILLAVGLPVLTILVYVWGYPSTPAPLPVVLLVDGLQLLIVLNAIAVAVQLVGRSGIRVSWVSGRRTKTMPVRKVPPPPQRSVLIGLRELCRGLVEMIWDEERKRGVVLGPAVLDYIRDAVTADLEHRRRRAVLDRRLAQLESTLTGGSGANAPDYDRR